MTTLIGRDRELARLSEIVERGGAAVLLRGEAGIGKSALLDAVRRSVADRGLGLLRTAGTETESGLPYAGLHRLLRPVLGGLGSLRPGHRRALSAALGLSDDPAGDPYLVGLAVLDLLLAQSRAVVLADDLQWLDVASRTVLGFSARHTADTGLAVIATARTGYDLGSLGFDELHLDGVDREAATAILDRRAGDLSDEVRERLLREAAGNPLALAELPVTHASGEPLPLSARLERAFASRLREMPPATRALLIVAAADEASSVLEIVGAAGTDAAAFDPAVAAQLVAVADGAVRYRHPLVRSAIYQSTPIEQRLAAHAALAQTLAHDPDRRAWHRAAATLRRDDDVAQAVEAVAWRAHARGAILDTAITLGRAARLTESAHLRAQRLLRAAELAFEAGRPDLVRQAVEEAQQLSLGVRDQARARLLSESFDDGVIGDVARVRALVAEARAVAALGDSTFALELLRGAAVRCWWGALDVGVRVEVLRTAETLQVSRLDPRRLAVLACAAPLERGAEVVSCAPEAVVSSGEDPQARWFIAMSVHAVGEHGLALSLLDALIPTLREQRRLGLLTQVLSMAQWDAVMLGEWERADALATEGDQLARETAQPVWGAGLICGLCAAAAMRGDAGRAERLATEAERRIVTHGMADMHTVLLTARGIAAVAAGRHEDAYAILSRIFDPRDPGHHYREQFGALGWLADAALGCGCETQGRALIKTVAAPVGPDSAPGLRHAITSARDRLAGRARRFAG